MLTFLTVLRTRIFVKITADWRILRKISTDRRICCPLFTPSGLTSSRLLDRDEKFSYRFEFLLVSCKSQQSLYGFGSAIYLLEKKYRFIPNMVGFFLIPDFFMNKQATARYKADTHIIVAVCPEKIGALGIIWYIGEFWNDYKNLRTNTYQRHSSLSSRSV